MQWTFHCKIFPNAEEENRSRNGLFLPEAGMTSLDKVARETRAEEMFVELLQRHSAQGRNVSHKPTANGYAPTTFAKEDKAKNHKFGKTDFEGAMQRLFNRDKIRVENYGRPSRPCAPRSPSYLEPVSKGLPLHLRLNATGARRLRFGDD